MGLGAGLARVPLADAARHPQHRGRRRAGESFIPPSSNRVDLNLNDTWKFNKGNVPGAEAVDFDDSQWDSIGLPHTWNNLDGQDGSNYYRGIGWYRKHIPVDPSYAGKMFYLQVDGSNSVTDVYVNGNFVDEHKGGFATFRFDVTPYIHADDDNVIAIKVNNAFDPDVPPLSADFTFFGGLYRGVHLLVTDPLQVTALDYGSSGVYLLQSNVTSDSADLQVTAKVINGYSAPKNVELNSVIVDGDNLIVAILSSAETVDAQSEFDFVQNTTLSLPHLWNGRQDPYLYAVYVEVKDADADGTADAVNDLVSQPVGFRSFSVDPDDGFFLNGRHLDLHGVNRHQDRLNKGWAISKADHEEDFNLIREMGATALRLAHYQHDQYFYDLADKYGMVVWAEIPLVNKITQSTAFYENTQQQLTELIRQNFNHPSICFWSIANEVTSPPDPNPLLQQLADLVAAEDPTRLSTLASCCVGENDVSTRHTDVVGFNRYYGWYYGSYNDFAGWADRLHWNYPAKVFAVSEFGAGASISFHSETPTRQDHTEEYQNLFHEAHWKAMKDRKFLWGKFVWNMFDFASARRREGDTPGRNDKGLVTYDRQTRKDAFYWYKANWSCDPVVYITSRRFTERSDPTTAGKVYSNADSVELFVNGMSAGVKGSSDRIFSWDNVTLLPGDNTIEADGTVGGTTYTDTVVWTLTV
jgi:beta-galactosidase